MVGNKFVYLEWHDAFASPGWYTDGEINQWKKGNFIVREAGWIIEETDKQLVLAMRHNLADSGDVQQWGSPHKIPKTWIRKRINLSKYIK